MNLYSNPMSGCSRRVLAFASVHAIELDHTTVDLRSGEHKRPAYLALNPTGRVPTLVTDDAGTFWESAAILRYLAEVNAPDALGTSPRERALVQQWTSWGIAHGAPAWSRLNAETGLKAMLGGRPDPAAVQAATRDAMAALTVLATALEERPFLAGDRPTIADFTIAASLEACTWLAGLELRDPAVRAWFDRMLALPGWPEDPRRVARG